MLTRGLTAYTRSLSSTHLTETQQDALALLSNANFELNSLRKEQIKPDMNPAYSHLCKAPVTKFLFGDDLGKRVKDLKEEQKATLGVVKSADQGKVRARPGQTTYHPYKATDTYRSQQYRSAGWSSPNNRPTIYRPFLGRRAPSRGRMQAQAPTQPMASQGRYRPNLQKK